MAKRSRVYLLLAVFLVFCTAARADTSRPIRQTELLALVAGNALPENIVDEIRSRGIAFRMNNTFRAQLKVAGAAPSVLAALSAAKAPAQDTAIDASNPVLVQQITTAAQLMKEKHYQEAADQLTDTLKGNFEKFEIGFIMGEILRQQENWEQAAAVYSEVLRQDPDFPEAHTKLSFVLYRSGDGEEALRQAKAALAHTPNNAEAHKNAGLALDALGKSDAAVAEYKEALHLKPDYGFVHLDMGLVLHHKRDFDGAIAEYKKAISLDPNAADEHYALGNAFGDKGDLDSAIREYREAKRLDPNFYDTRQNLGAALMKLQMYPEAIREFRELEAIFPDAAICRVCLGRALKYTGDLKGAEKEFRIAAKLDPSDPEALLGLGSLLEDQKDYDGALAEYRAAEELDESSLYVHRSIGTVLLTRKDVAGALKELKIATDLNPSQSYSHYLYAQALLLSGDVDAAIGEFKESLGLDRKQANVRLDLAGALEKKGDWVAALDQYRQAAVDDSFDPTTIRPGTGVRVYDAAQKYTEAKERFSQHLASLRQTGKSSEAAQLEKSLIDTQSTASASQKLDTLMQSGSKAFTERRFDDSERDYKQALQIAETVQPPDTRLVTILAHLGNLAAFRSDYTGASVFFERQLKIAEQLSGSQNPMAVTDPLRSLAMTALAQHDFASAKKFADRALDANRKFYGENSVGFAQMLPVVAGIYLSQQDYEHAEPYLLQAVNIEEKLYNYDATYGGMEISMLMTLCVVYEKWDKPEKLEPYDRRLISILEKQSGPDTHVLESTLAREAKTLRTLGRSQEAAEVERRLKSLQPSAANNPN
jgi:tetratricopeptide (TPR) repeat protein